MSHGPLVRAGIYRGQVINEVLAYAILTVCSVGPQIHLVVIPPVLGCVIGINILSSWQNPHLYPDL